MKTRIKNLSESTLAFLAPSFLHYCLTRNVTLSGGEANTTNNRMELTGVIEGLKALKRPCDVILTTDSKYIVDAITKGWVYKWKSQNWMRDKKSPALNSDLWRELLPLLEIHNVEFVWVKGHAGHRENEICDSLAVSESMKYK